MDFGNEDLFLAEGVVDLEEVKVVFGAADVDL